MPTVSHLCVQLSLLRANLVLKIIFLDTFRYLIGITIRKQWQSPPRQPWTPSVNLYITELGVLFGGHKTIEVQC
jgi:hypothetical protein